MHSNEDLPFETHDPLVAQAEKIFAQRQSRALVIDRDLLGEPGWDILLCAFIAYRRGLACNKSDVAREIGLSISVTKRWIDILSLRGLPLQRDDFFIISEETELKLSTMFDLQIKQAFRSFSIRQKAHTRGAIGQT